MLPPITYLNEFIQPAPVCLETASLLMVLETLSHNEGDFLSDMFHESLVLMNHQHQPTGLLRLHKLLPHLVAAGFLKPGLKAAQSTLPVLPRSTKRRSASLRLLELAPSVVEPLTLVQDDLPWPAFLAALRSQPHSNYAVINRNGKFLGLLDHTRLLTHLLLNPLALLAPDTAQTQTAQTQTTQTQTARQQILKEQVRKLLVQNRDLRVQWSSSSKLTAEPGDPYPASRTEPVERAADPFPLAAGLHSLLELLERFPLPLMVQTSEGRVVTQNSVWKQQVGELMDPAWVRQEAALLLETPPTQATEVPHPPFPPEIAYSYGADSALSHLEGNRCQRGPQPDTCICTCSLKNGQEQVLQFVKVPLGTLVPQPAFEPLPSGVGSDRRSNPQAINGFAAAEQPTFRLATLNLPSSAAEPGNTCWRSPSVPPVAEPQAVHPAQEAIETLWLILAQDITEQQQLARELTAKNADLVQLNRLKDEFLACISHELRTPLTAVLGLSSLLKDQTLGELNQRQAHYAQLIYQSGRHLMTVVNDILDLTRMETGQLELVPEPVDIVTVCKHAFDQASQLRLLEDKQAKTETAHPMPQFSLEVEADLNLIVADELRLRQMLVHLLSNALKFTEVERQIGLKVSRWGGWIAFTVWDTGIGIPADKQHLIFQKFQQLENPLTRRFDGTGLGLVLTQRLARLHGGEVTFLSKEGEGSQFTILLPPSPPDKMPLAQREEDGLHTQPHEYPSGRISVRSTPRSSPGETRTPAVRLDESTVNRDRLVLIVEATAQFIEALSEQLSGLGYRVVIARSGTEALEKARRLQPCIIFLNPLLPLLSGWDVLTLLKSSPETRHIPVAVTATRVDEEQAYSKHADAVLSLPVQPKALRQCLQQQVVEATAPKAANPASPSLTVLRLSADAPSDGNCPISAADLYQLLHLRHYRILEAEDLEQAELLARVWKPNVVLLDSPLADPAAYFQQFRQHTFLASLPLVTLGQETTQAANQVPGILVFPCLLTPDVHQAAQEDPESCALLQAIQIAAGYTWRPSILALDVATLPPTADSTQLHSFTEAGLDSFPQETEWLRALNQYLQTAGFRSLLGRSWQEVLQQVQSQSIDLLVICWTESDPQPMTLQMLYILQQLERKPPILVLDHRNHCPEQSQSSPELPSVLRHLARHILPPSLPMTDLLNQIHLAIRG